MNAILMFDHTTGTTSTVTWEVRQQHLLRCEAALRCVWEETGSYRTTEADEVAGRCHEIAHKALEVPERELRAYAKKVRAAQKAVGH